jgi:hypothetical protein
MFSHIFILCFLNATKDLFITSQQKLKVCNNYQLMNSVDICSTKLIGLSHAGAVILEGVDNSSSNIHNINGLNPSKKLHPCNSLLVKN